MILTVLKYITLKRTVYFNSSKLLRLDENENEIPTQIGLVTVLFDTKTVQEDLLAQTPNACISSNTNIETGELQKQWNM